MSDEQANLDEALEDVFTAARAHLAAVKSASGRVDDDGVWTAYVALNNASFAYDGALLQAYGEVTPWDVDSIDPEHADEKVGELADLVAAGDPYQQVISVRQRRDYRVPSVAALLTAAQTARLDAMDGAEAPVESVGEAVLELLQSGDGSLAALDLPELEPLDGLVAVAEVAGPLDLAAYDEVDGAGPFMLASPDRLIGRLDEQPFVDLDDHGGDE